MVSRKPVEERIVLLRNKIQTERAKELRRAIGYQDVGDPQKAMYHTGLADGMNRITRELDLILTGGESVWLST